MEMVLSPNIFLCRSHNEQKVAVFIRRNHFGYSGTISAVTPVAGFILWEDERYSIVFVVNNLMLETKYVHHVYFTRCSVERITIKIEILA